MSTGAAVFARSPSAQPESSAVQRTPHHVRGGIPGWHLLVLLLQ